MPNYDVTLNLKYELRYDISNVDKFGAQKRDTKARATRQ